MQERSASHAFKPMEAYDHSIIVFAIKCLVQAHLGQDILTLSPLHLPSLSWDTNQYFFQPQSPSL